MKLEMMLDLQDSKYTPYCLCIFVSENRSHCDKSNIIYAPTCKIWIRPVSNRTYLHILNMMKLPKKVIHLVTC